jgi:hypothetical protein
VLRRWLAGEGVRATERLIGFDRTTVGGYVDAMVGARWSPTAASRSCPTCSSGWWSRRYAAPAPTGTGRRGGSVRHHDEIAEPVVGDLTWLKTAELLERHGGVFRPRRCNATSRRSSAAPPVEVRGCPSTAVNRGRMGPVFDPVRVGTGRTRWFSRRLSADTVSSGSLIARHRVGDRGVPKRRRRSSVVCSRP